MRASKINQKVMNSEVVKWFMFIVTVVNLLREDNERSILFKS